MDENANKHCSACGHLVNNHGYTVDRQGVATLGIYLNPYTFTICSEAALRTAQERVKVLEGVYKAAKSLGAYVPYGEITNLGQVPRENMRRLGEALEALAQADAQKGGGG